MALFLASDESSFVSGQAIAVDGALTTGREPNPERQQELLEMAGKMASGDF